MKRFSRRHSRSFRLLAALLLVLMCACCVTSCEMTWDWAAGLTHIKPTETDLKASETDRGGTDAAGQQFSDITGFAVNTEGHLLLYMGDGNTLELNISGEASALQKTEPAEIIRSNITVNVADGGADLSYAASKALLSAVSVYCTFEKTTTVDPFSWFIYGGRAGDSTTTQTYASAGSGVIFKLDKEKGDAYIITNYHVVFDADANTKNHISNKIQVFLYGSENTDSAIPADYVGGSLYYDIAVLKVTNNDFLRHSVAEAATFGNSDSVTAGQIAMVVGNPEAGGISVTSGIVSVPSEYIAMTGADQSTQVSFRVIRVDAAVNEGNSGGGLFNASGDLVGIINAKIIDDAVENIGYAIPTSVVRAIADNILFYCDNSRVETVQRGMLGITVQATDSHAVVDATTGLVGIMEKITVYEVTKGGLADGKLKKGDWLRSITVDGKTTEITRQYHVIDSMLDARVGSVVTIEYTRDNEAGTATFILTSDDLTSY